MEVGLAQLAARRGGLLTRADLLAAGVHPDRLRGWVRRGRLKTLYRGVYTWPGLALTPELIARAATLAVDLPAAAASHGTAADVHGIGVLVLAGRAHVTVPESVHRQSRPGLVVHRCRLADAEVVDLDGLRVTGALRTVHDLLVGPSPLAGVWAGEAALQRQLVTEDALDHLTAQSGGRPYADRLRQRRALVDARSESPLETAIRLVLHDTGLPMPESQHEVRTRDGHLLARIDLAWPANRLGLEADGKEPHGQLRPVYTDRWRTNALVGWQLVRFTWYDVLRRPAYVVATVRAHLTAAA